MADSTADLNKSIAETIDKRCEDMLYAQATTEPTKLELPFVETLIPPTPPQSSIAKFASGLQLDDDEDF